ncbi:hypothetical protein [Pseudonocardia sp. D17]|uniref:hypothetical protein n=1 Tax=Pseudonocardia sp. D17 TaxID=882661 RepID=UPI002B3E2E29|nr:hypothetical protein PSD17_39280 [Pseudonocardia sp. D17]
MSVQVVSIGAARPVQVVRLDRPGVTVVETGGVTLPPAATRVDDLLDVDAPPAVVGLLERQDDQIVRPVTRDAVLAPHVAAPAPHPAYDDLPSLRLLFENGLI